MAETLTLWKIDIDFESFPYSNDGYQHMPGEDLNTNLLVTSHLKMPRPLQNAYGAVLGV